MKKIILSALIAILVSVSASASNVYPFPVTITQSDGTQLTVIGYGDEHLHWFTTIDGVLLCRVKSDFYIAKTSEGDIAPTACLAHEPAMRSAEEIELIKAQDQKAFMRHVNKTRQQLKARYEPVTYNSSLLVHEGTPRVPVVLVDFPDVNFSITDPKKSFEQYLNGNGRPENYGNREDRNYGSVGQYFEDMSFGKFRPKFEIYGPVRLPKNSATYGAGRDDRMDLFLPDVVNAIKDQLDFTQYDANKDGNVDLFYVIYAGYAASLTQNSEECLWPKSGSRNIGVGNGLIINRYGISNELNGYPNAFTTEPYARINGIGLFCHEFSHCMGLPDFYPTQSGVAGDNQAMERWSLMDGGEYTDNGWCPSAYTAWEREAFDWMTIDELTEDAQNLNILPIDQEGGKAYRIRSDRTSNNSHEYFVIENRQKKGWNQRQEGHGLLVYHVNYIESLFSLSSNSVNNVKGKPNMVVVPADGLLASSRNIGQIRDYGTGENGKVTNQDYYRHLAGDVFPGNQEVTELNENMELPNFQLYNLNSGATINKALANIRESEEGVITIDFISDYNAYKLGIDDNTSLSKQSSAGAGSVFTLDGRKINGENLTKGIYIVGGKKIVVTK